MADPELVAHLQARGATDAEVDGLDDSGLIGLAGDLVVARALPLSLAELAERCGTDEERLRAVYRSLGLDADALPGFGDGDIALLSLLDGDVAGVIDEVAEDLMRVAGTSLRRLAEATVASYVQDVEHHPDREPQDLIAMAELNALATGLMQRFADVLGPMFTHHMWVAVRGQRSGQHEVGSPELLRAGVGFVDLVGFTPRSRSMTPAELMAFVDDFERRSFAIAVQHGGRIVKSIGDEVMLTAPDLDTVATIALELVAAFGDEGTRPRGGVSAGEVGFRLGDLYGPVVNVAARLVAVAEPGEVLTDVAPSAAAAVEARPAGARELKGFAEPVDVWSVASVVG